MPRRSHAVREDLLHMPDAPGVGLEWDEGAAAANLAEL
jgi:mandelate racemase